jgi:hypothetical protein
LQKEKKCKIKNVKRGKKKTKAKRRTRQKESSEPFYMMM